jgi:hypothetical protein
MKSFRSPGAAIADDIGGALDEGRLRPRLRFDDLDVHPRSVLVLDQFADPAVGEAGTAAVLCLPLLKAHQMKYLGKQTERGADVRLFRCYECCLVTTETFDTLARA